VQPSRLLVLAGLSLFAACGGDGGTDPGNQSGSLTFNYSGGTSGTFNASGAVPTNEDDAFTTNWAAGFRDDATQSVVLQAVATRAGGRHDHVIIAIDRVTTGTSNVDVNCDPDFDESCTGLVVFIGETNTTFEYQFLCFLETGSMNISSISNSRVQGTFSGSGFCIDEDFVESSFSVTGGTFNVALVADVPT
jgi:hypothetical protein